MALHRHHFLLVLLINCQRLASQNNYPPYGHSYDQPRHMETYPNRNNDRNYYQTGWEQQNYGGQWPQQQQPPRPPPLPPQQQQQQQHHDGRYNSYNDQPWNQPRDQNFAVPSSNTNFGLVKPPNMDVSPKPITVETALGTVTGNTITLFDGPHVKYYDRPGSASRPIAREELFVHAFLGIPYAVPPEGERRFKPPERFGRFQTYDAQFYRPACPQPETQSNLNLGEDHFKENCLHLNIFTPAVSGISMPVMIYIHGGEFESGSGNYFPGHMLAASQGVVVVTFNYRLGPLGFLSTGDEASPGNYGMLDQATAIRWVYENVHSFGGNAEQITLFGPGAGGASAGLHMISPLSKDYVKRVIAQSGSAVADWAVTTNVEKAVNTSRVFGERMGCRVDSSWKLVNCLRKRSFKELCNRNIKPDIGFFPWAPIVDKDIVQNTDYRFLPEAPKTLFYSRLFNPNREYLSGVTRDEAAYLLLKDFSFINNNYQVTPEYFNAKVKEFIKQYNYTLNPDGIYRAMTYMYTNWADPYHPSRRREEYINMMSDAIFRAPNDEMVKIMVTKGVSTYMYVLNTTVEAFKWDDWRAVPHDAEFYFLTGAPFMEKNYFAPYLLQDMKRDWTEGDRNMSTFFMTSFANFARTGNPSQLPVLDISFKRMVKEPGRILYYLNLNNTLNSSIDQNYRQLECSFWTQYLPSLIGAPPSTTPLPMDQNVEFQIGFYSVIAAAALFFLLMFIMCCLYCRAMSSRHRFPYYEESLVPEDNYSTQTPTPLTFLNQKNSGKFDNQQHTTV